MGIKRLRYNRETKIIEVIEEEQQILETRGMRPKEKRDTINFVISILSLIISIGALGISYSQKSIDEKQADVSIRQFDLNKKPVFESFIEREELYDDEVYWNYYNNWLYENDIKAFDEWQRKRSPGKEIPYINGKTSRVFWNAYDTNDFVTLDELTNGEFSDLQKEYSDYLLSKNYMRYDNWKEYYYVYEKDYITLRNIGGNITNARLKIYTFIMYYLKIGDEISYAFAIDTNEEILSEYWKARYYTNSAYDSGNNAFYIEYTQDYQLYNDENLEITNLLNFLSSNEILKAIGLDENSVEVFNVVDRPVYFLIEYLDSEQEEQADWFQYDIKNNTLNHVKTHSSDVEVPDFTKEGFSNAYYEAYTLRVAQTLGYQNAQWRPFFAWDDFSYLENAKQKIIFDLKELVSGR